VRLLALGIVIGALLVPRLSSSHTPPGGTTARIHHGATALLWLNRHAGGVPRPLLRRSERQHDRLLMDGLRRVGFYHGALCVHRHEGAWNDPHAPFYGGMQMDYSFQKAHGPVYLRRWGTADRWPVWAQLHASYDGWSSRGWHPWPNTARACGLL
jgi:hypothetical protein